MCAVDGSVAVAVGTDAVADADDDAVAVAVAVVSFCVPFGCFIPIVRTPSTSPHRVISHKAVNLILS